MGGDGLSKRQEMRPRHSNFISNPSPRENQLKSDLIDGNSRFAAVPVDFGGQPIFRVGIPLLGRPSNAALALLSKLGLAGIAGARDRAGPEVIGKGC